MGRRRAPTDDERELFESTLADAVPLKKAPRPKKKTPPKPAPAATVTPTEVRQQKPASALRRSVGIDGNTAERLRRGLLAPQARLDLHGLTERDAHRALVTFLRGARIRKLRLVLIVTGKGGPAAAQQMGDVPFDLGLDMRTRGVLRIMTPRWLQEPGLAELIADAREAHRRHGGQGALYVYLRKG
ncbi:MAG TPA: Smr/MutS family protein [Rhizomicrobium sp.]|jgi:DNA-nicking Smr family endonuclease|nr:Smr/MutS family protein [Rhizomicrobium sp.]